MSSLKEQDQRRLSEHTLLDIITLSADAIAIYTGNDIIFEFANNAMLNFWGKGPEIMGLPLYTGVPELQGQPFEQMLQEVLRTGITDAGIRIAETRIAGTLQKHYYEYEYRAIPDENGIPYAILHRAANVTERELHKISLQAKELEVQALNQELAASNEELSKSNQELAIINKELQTSNVDIRRLNKELREYTGGLVKMYERLAESEGRFRELVRQAPVASFILKGENMIIEMANNMMLEMIGKNASIVGKSLTEAIPEIKGQPVEDLLTHVYKTGETFYGNELPAYLAHHGELVKGYYKFIYQPLKSPEGVTHSIVCIVLDITEQVTARKMAEQAEERLQLAVEATELGIWSVDWKTQKLNISARSRSINGVAPKREITLEESFELIDPEHRDHVVRQLHAAVASKTSFNAEHLVHPMDGGPPKWLRSTGKATYNDVGEPILMTGTILDITEEKRNDQRKNDFISMVSHELKTPLTSMNGYIQLLQRNATRNGDESSVVVADKAIRQVDRMARLINGFLNVARLESNQIHIDRSRFDLAELMIEIKAETSMQVTSHNIVFAPVETTIVYADRDKIGQVINNLISNAIKYSGYGSSINVACITEDGRAVVSVKDKGMGVNKVDLPKLFDRFYRVNNTESQTIAGFGIGLYLCAEIIMRHDGKIWADSEIGSGSTFYFTLAVTGF